MKRIALTLLCITHAAVVSPAIAQIRIGSVLQGLKREGCDRATQADANKIQLALTQRANMENGRPILVVYARYGNEYRALRAANAALRRGIPSYSVVCGPFASYNQPMRPRSQDDIGRFRQVLVREIEGDSLNYRIYGVVIQTNDPRDRPF